MLYSAPAQGGVCSWGVCLLPGGFSLPGGVLPASGVSPPGGLSLPGGFSLLGGFSLPGYLSVNRITQTCKNITLATTSLRPVITLHRVFMTTWPRFFSNQYGALKTVRTVDPFLFTPKKFNFSENLNKIFIWQFHSSDIASTDTGVL